MKETMVTVRCEALGSVRMRFLEAETLLRMHNNGGWELDDKEYEYDREIRRIVRKRRKKGVSE